MKKYFISLTLIMVCLFSQAQYKKASFLTKSGRTYDLGFTAHLLSKGGSLMPGIYYSYGKDKGEKRLFHWFDLELLLPSTFKINTIDIDTKVPVVINGKTRIGLVYRYNLACYLVDNTNEEIKLLPFVTGGINLLLAGGQPKSWTTDPEYAHTETQVAMNNFSYGANAGVGVVYNLTQKFGLKAVAGYNYQGNTNPNSDYGNMGYKVYNTYSSHPYVSVGVRFRMEGED